MSETNKEKGIISQHIFMFPFRFKTNETNKNNKTLQEFEDKLKDEGWKRTPFSFSYGEKDAHLKYNEWVYFHEYARRALFDDNTDQSVVRHFEREIPKDAHIVYHLENEIKVSDDKYECKKNWKVLDLKIKNISLFLFETNVGILSIELTNETPKDNREDWEELDDVLLINDFGRRIYPQFIGETAEDMDDSDCNNGTNATKNAFLADEIEFYFGNSELIVEKFDTKDYLKMDLEIAKYIKYLLGSLKDKIVPLIDDRMYTVCWYGNNKLSEFLSTPQDDGKYNYETSDEWYKFVYIDGKDIGVANDRMKEQLIKNATYDRWAKYGTLFGISRYSLVAITNRSDIGYDNIIREHMRGVYHKMAILLLAQRASIVSFFNEVTNISQILKDKNRKKNKDILQEVRSLFSSLIYFENRLHLAEVTPQEQGIEMYNMAYKIMGIDELSEDLKYEVEKLHDFIDLLHMREQEETFQTIQIAIGLLSIFGISSAIVSALALNYYVNLLGYAISAQVLYIILVVILCVILRILSKKGGDKKWNL